MLLMQVACAVIEIGVVAGVMHLLHRGRNVTHAGAYHRAVVNAHVKTLRGARCAGKRWCCAATGTLLRLVRSSVRTSLLSCLTLWRYHTAAPASAALAAMPVHATARKSLYAGGI